MSRCAQQTQPGRPGSAGTGPGPPRAWIHSGGGGGGGVTGPAPSACTLVRAQGHGGRGWAGRRQGDLEWAVSAGWGFPGRRGGRGRVEHKSPWSLENSTNHPILFGKSSFFFKVRRLAQQRGGRGSYGGGCARPPGRPPARRSVQGPGPAGGGGAPACSRHRPRRHLTLSPPPPTSLLPQKRTSETARVHNSAYTYII